MAFHTIINGPTAKGLIHLKEHHNRKMLGVLPLVFSYRSPSLTVKHDLRKNKIVVASITGFFRY
jgi:hypothetical protein